MEKAESLCTDRATTAASRPNLALKNMMPAGGIETMSETWAGHNESKDQAL
jgi:hypothetical protein